MVSGFGREQRAFLGTRAGDQAADPDGDLRAAVCVVSSAVECAVPVDGERRGWDSDPLPAFGDRGNVGRPQEGCCERVGVLAREDSGACGEGRLKTGGDMCPVCLTNYLTTAALVASSTGGLAAVVVKKLGLKKQKLKENGDATTQNRV